jgi:hypothetical protein
MSINSTTCSGIFWWKPGAWLRVTGPDAATFLQGQFTNDLRALDKQPAVYGLWLTVKGKVVADSFVLRGAQAGEFCIGSYFSPAATIRERLESHIIADDVVVEDATAEWNAVSIFEGDSPVSTETTGVGGFVFPGRRGAASAEWIFPNARIEAVRTRLAGRRELSVEEVARLRIAAGIPAIPADVGPADLPNEGGLEADAISYNKGCYLGQEVMARLKSMGQVRRRLLRVRGSAGAIPSLPAAVFTEARQVGELRSAARIDDNEWIGLAMVSLMHVTPGAGLSLAAGTPPAMYLIDAP